METNNNELLKDYPDVMTIEETASALKLSKSFLYKQASEGVMPFRRFGNKYRISKKKLIEYLEDITNE